MAKSDFKSNSLLPIVLVAGILGGGVWRPAPQAEAGKSEELSGGSERTDVTLPPTPWVSDMRPAMDSIAAALGANPADLNAEILARASQVALQAAEDTRNRAQQGTEKERDHALQEAEKERDLEILTGMARLRTGLNSSLAPQGLICSGDSADLDQAAMTIAASFLSNDGGKAKTRTDAAAALVNEYRDWRSLIGLASRAKDPGNSSDRVPYDVNFIVATIPDYVDSNSGWLADQSLAAIQSGMISDGYLFDRVKLIDWSRSAAAASVAPGSRLHERQPGAMIFRRVHGNSIHLQVVLLVLETPTAGVHQMALRNSLSFVRAWNACRGANPGQLRVLGPTFSGSTLSLAMVLAEFKDAFTDRVVITGSANADENVAQMTTFSNGAIYRATVQPSSVLKGRMADFLASMNADWKHGHRVALLVESNTAYGNLADKEDCCFPQAAIFSFPLHVAQLRSDAPALSQPGAALLPTAIVPLNLREPSPPTDLIPALRPQLTSPVVEATVEAILDTIRHEKLTAVGIIATDDRDVLFLAREVKRAAPDVQLFLFGAHALYLHPDYTPYLRGALVASSYSLSLANQPEAGDKSACRGGGPSTTQADLGNESRRCPREPFQSMSAEGILYATRALLVGHDQSRTAATVPEYCSGAVQPRREQDSSSRCVPVAPVSINVIADDGYWTLPPADVVSSAEPYKGIPPPPPLNAYRLPPLPDRIVIGVGLIVVLVLIHFVALYLSRSGSSTRPADSKILELPFVRIFAPPTTVSTAARRHRLAVTVCFVLLALVAAWAAAIAIPFATSPTFVAPLVMFLPPLMFGGAVTVAIGLYTLADPDPDAAPPRIQLHGGTLHDGGSPATRSSLTMFGLTGRLVFVGVLGTMTLLGWVTLLLIGDGAGGPERSIVLSRIAGGGILSPTALTVSLIAAIYTAIFMAIRRLSLVGRSYQRLSAGSPAFAFLTGRKLDTPDDVEETSRFARVLDMPAESLPPVYPLAILIVLALAGLVARKISTIDGPAFSWFLGVGSLTALGLASLLVAQALATWNAARPHLKRLARSHLEPHFKDVAGQVPWDLSMAPPRLSELMPVARMSDGVMRDFRTFALAALDTPDARRLRRNLGDFSPLRSTAETRIGVRDEDLAQLAPLFAPPSHVENLEKERQKRRCAALIQSKTWFELWLLSDAIVNLLEKTYWLRTNAHKAPDEPAGAVAKVGAQVAPRPPGSGAAARDGWFARCEQLVALQMAFVLRDVAARTVTCLFAGLLCLTFLTASHLFYSFNGRAGMLTVDLLAVAGAALSAIWILVDMERDHVLSRLRDTAPGRVDINWDFIKRIAVYGVLPLLAVIAALFPEVGGTLFGWLEPLRRLSNL